ncbi:1-phosphatidylinositol 4,5-bisphosphate phosphodiesterase delta-1-like isoform X3 [Mytilus galloprovincialis]|uniref:1-phosphatidylinositol 4,5-bisphosphate phosphodiesterase delta-1-like isoform X3 n=1 Tax=Mytilus galloprovincialis TaxID=29158 RepID=UPI003F7C31E6
MPSRVAKRGLSTKESIVTAGHGGHSGSGTYVRPGGGYVYLEEDLTNGQVMDVTDKYVVTEPSRRHMRHMQAPVKTLTTNGSMISAEPSLISMPRHRQEKIVTRVLPANQQIQRVAQRRVVSPQVVQGGYRTVIDSSRGVMMNGGQQIIRQSQPSARYIQNQQVIREVQPSARYVQSSQVIREERPSQRYIQNPQMVQQVVRRSAPGQKYYVSRSSDYTSGSSSDSSTSDSDEERTVISKGEVVHAVIRDNWTFSKREPKEEKIVTSVKTKKGQKDDDASSSASSSSLESRKLKILEQVRDNGVENGQVIVNDNGTPVIVKMRGNKKNKKEKKGKKEKKKAEVDRILKALSEGMVLHKIKDGGILYPRKFILDTQNMKLRYTGSEKKFRKKKTSWDLSNIREVREGEKDYAKRLEPFDRGRCIAVIFGANHHTLHLLTESKPERDMWLKGLRFAQNMEQYMDQKEQTDKWIRDAFMMADKNNDERLDFEEVLKLLKQLNADMDKKYVHELFDKADTNKGVGERSTLDSEEFVHFYHSVTERIEIEEIFLKYDGGKGYFSADDLQRFMKEQQKENVSEDQAKEYIAAYEPQKNMQLEDQMSLIGFRCFLCSKDQQIFKPAHTRVYQDMNRPVTHYFVNSSHNTYLAEDQLKGPSKVEAYITALSNGCRCVELDCWDGPDDEPVIYHGYTLTSKILFHDVISAIKEYAFQASPYPVILSIENHCSVKQQAVMANKINAIFGDLLYAPEEPPATIPSPSDLMGKIILKGKRLATVGNAVPENEEEHEVSDEDEAAEVQDATTQEKERAPKKKSKLKLSPKFSAAIGMKAVSYKGIEETLATDGMFASIGENKVLKIIDHDPEGLNKLSQKLFVRTYPAGSRTDSSNYNPTPMWNVGCQVVALNFQTGGEPLQLNHGKFMDNGGCGYILKPQFLLSSDKFGIVTEKIKNPKRRKLIVKIISAYQIPKPNNSKKGEIIDPFVKIEIHGVKSDQQSVKTSVKNNNGFKPRWDEVVRFKISVPELALVRLVIYDHDRYLDDFIGYNVVPVLSMQEGYRHIPLFSKNGDKMPQALVFVHIEFEDDL